MLNVYFIHDLYSNVTIDSTGIPMWINVIAITPTTITIQWGAISCIQQNSEITGYKVRYGPVGSSQRATETVTGSASTGGMYTLTGLLTFTNYSIELAAVDSNGDIGHFTHPIINATTAIISCKSVLIHCMENLHIYYTKHFNSWP